MHEQQLTDCAVPQRLNRNAVTPRRKDFFIACTAPGHQDLSGLLHCHSTSMESMILKQMNLPDSLKLLDTAVSVAEWQLERSSSTLPRIA
jgi:hypothetical protein